MWSPIEAISGVMQCWGLSAWGYFTGEDGYKVLVAAGAAYVALHKIFETRHQFLATRASSERATLLSSESSPAEALISAMGNFGPVQTMIVPPAPHLLKPLRLFGQTAPNQKALWTWARDVFDSFSQDYEDPKTGLRIDLRRANLRGADLHEVNLQKVDLRSVDLQGADLQRADLHGANLVGANLQKANLREANLRESNLSGANLQGAALYKANLSAATLRRANLSAADLSAADLRWANLRLANLSRSTVDRADLRLADLSGTSLRGVKGLEKAKRDDSDESLPTKIQYKIGVSYQDLKLPFVAALQKSVGKSAQEDVDLTEKDAEGSVQKELDNVKGMLENIDCLAFEAVSLDDSKGSIEAANLKGVPVIEFNVKANGGDWVTFVGSEHAESGDWLAKWLIGYQEESGKVVKGIYLRAKGEITDVARNYALRARLKRLGFTDEKIKFVTESSADYDREKAKAEINALLTTNSDLDFIIANNDSMVLGALDALDQHRIGGKVALAGIDGLPETLEEIKRGRIKATIFQDPELQGARAVKACVDCLKRKGSDKEILIPFMLVTIDNVDEFKEIANRVYPKSQ